MTASYTIAQVLFLRGMGLISAVAFVSLLHQVKALYGRRGILPLEETCARLRKNDGNAVYWNSPSLFWLFRSDAFIWGVCAAGLALSLLWVWMPFIWGLPFVLAVLYVSFLPLGQNFMALQWDGLLVECLIFCGFLNLMAPAHPWVLVWGWVLVFRFYFSNGVVKWTSEDPSWRNLTALKVHYMTQPLPGPLSYFAYHLPMWVHKLSTAGTLIMECGVPFMFFASDPWRSGAGVLLIGFQLLIILTGNFAFFNWVGIAMACLLISNQTWGYAVVNGVVSAMPDFLWWGIALIAIGFILIHLWHLLSLFGTCPRSMRRLLRWCNSRYICNSYGAFSVMTTERYELALEGSLDGQTFAEFEFKWKPGSLNRWPGQVAPFQPRVDWQMWFAALDPDRLPYWLIAMIQRLKQGEPGVQNLLAFVPFERKPIPYIQLVYYRYVFTDWTTWRASKAIWTRTRLGELRI